MTDEVKRMIIKTLVDTSVSICIKMGYDASQKGLDVNMVVATSSDKFSDILTDALLEALDKLDNSRGAR